MLPIFKTFQTLFGLSESGYSLIGKYSRKILARREVAFKVAHNLAGVTIISLASAIYFVHHFANMGGPVKLSINTSPAKAAVETRTTLSIQTPVNYVYESRGYSWFHSGADLVTPIGTVVRPIMEGEVEATPYDPFGYGDHIIIRHTDGYESLYGHLSVIYVHPGEKVNMGTTLGLSGSTGFSTGPHLHLELRLNGAAINPAGIVPGVN